MPESTPMPVSVCACRAGCIRRARYLLLAVCGAIMLLEEETMSQQVVLAGDRSTLPGPSPWTVTLGP